LIEMRRSPEPGSSFNGTSREPAPSRRATSRRPPFAPTTLRSGRHWAQTGRQRQFQMATNTRHDQSQPPSTEVAADPVALLPTGVSDASPAGVLRRGRRASAQSPRQRRAGIDATLRNRGCDALSPVVSNESSNEHADTRPDLLNQMDEPSRETPCSGVPAATHRQLLDGLRMTHNPKVAGSNPAPATICPGQRIAGRGFYRVAAVFSRRFNRADPVEGVGATRSSKTRAASACMPGKTC
jgi:hypothetical protein